MPRAKKAQPATKGYVLTIEGEIGSDHSFNGTKKTPFCIQTTDSVTLEFIDSDVVLKGDDAKEWVRKSGFGQQLIEGHGIMTVPVERYAEFGTKPKRTPAKKKAANAKASTAKDVTQEYKVEQLANAVEGIAGALGSITEQLAELKKQ